MRPLSHKHLLFSPVSLAPYLSLMKEADRSPAGLNDGLMDVRLKPPYPGNHSFYVATSITAATNITSHMSCSRLSMRVGVRKCVCTGQFNGRILYQETGCFDGDSKQSNFHDHVISTMVYQMN